MDITTYTREKKAALKSAALKLSKLSSNDRLKLALDMGISINTLNSYKSGTGTSFEMALRIIAAK